MAPPSSTQSAFDQGRPAAAAPGLEDRGHATGDGSVGLADARQPRVVVGGLDPFGPIAAGVLADLEREARDVERFLGSH